MNVRRTAAALTAAAALTISGVALAAPANAAPPTTQTARAGAGLVAAVLQVSDVRVVSIQDSPITVDRVVRIGNVNVDVQDVLNNNTILQDFLNNNTVNVDIADVVDIAIVRNTLIVVVNDVLL